MERGKGKKKKGGGGGGVGGGGGGGCGGGGGGGGGGGWGGGGNDRVVVGYGPQVIVIDAVVPVFTFVLPATRSHVLVKKPNM